MKLYTNESKRQSLKSTSSYAIAGAVIIIPYNLFGFSTENIAVLLFEFCLGLISILFIIRFAKVRKQTKVPNNQCLIELYGLILTIAVGTLLAIFLTVPIFENGQLVKVTSSGFWLLDFVAFIVFMVYVGNNTKKYVLEEQSI
jgi:ABC-type Fe3+-siderophore transport system permease subunit